MTYWVCLAVPFALGIYRLLAFGDWRGIAAATVGAAIGIAVAKVLKRRWGWR